MSDIVSRAVTAGFHVQKFSTVKKNKVLIISLASFFISAVKMGDLPYHHQLSTGWMDLDEATTSTLDMSANVGLAVRFEDSCFRTTMI